jgi:hypothetical protein
MSDKYARTILFVLPSVSWTTRERAAFRDMQMAKMHGYNILLCTYLDSFLSQKAQAAGIEIISYHDHVLNYFFSFHKFYSFKKIFKHYSIDIVHCYDFSLLFSLTSQLKVLKYTSLVFSQDCAIDKPLQRFWFRPLIARIDSLVLLNKNLEPDALGNLGVSRRKIEHFGMGLKDEISEFQNETAINFALYKDSFLVGTYLSPELSDCSSLSPLLLALKVLNEKKSLGKQSKLCLISSIEFSQMKLLSDLRTQIEVLELRDEVLFITAKEIEAIIPHLNLWISSGATELIEDFAMSSMMHGVPALMARNFCSRDFLEEYPGLGETYKTYDARELRDKWEKIMLSFGIFHEKLRLYRFFIERDHNYLNYKNQLLGLYTRTVQRRLRVFRKKSHLLYTSK